MGSLTVVHPDAWPCMHLSGCHTLAMCAEPARCLCSQILELMKHDIKPRDIMTRAAFENAMVIVMALGGSTNAVLHLLAMARACEVPLTLDDFQAASDRTPFIADLKPSGKYVMEDVHKVKTFSTSQSIHDHE